MIFFQARVLIVTRVKSKTLIILYRYLLCTQVLTSRIYPATGHENHKNISKTVSRPENVTISIRWTFQVSVIKFYRIAIKKIKITRVCCRVNSDFSSFLRRKKMHKSKKRKSQKTTIPLIKLDWISEPGNHPWSWRLDRGFFFPVEKLLFTAREKKNWIIKKNHMHNMTIVVKRICFSLRSKSKITITIK